MRRRRSERADRLTPGTMSTSEAVRRFQSEAGLVADGVAGPLTQIALYGGLSRYPVPRLSAAALEGTDLSRSPEGAPAADLVAETGGRG